MISQVSREKVVGDLDEWFGLRLALGGLE